MFEGENRGTIRDFTGQILALPDGCIQPLPPGELPLAPPCWHRHRGGLRRREAHRGGDHAAQAQSTARRRPARRPTLPSERVAYSSFFTEPCRLRAAHSSCVISGLCASTLAFPMLVYNRTCSRAPPPPPSSRNAHGRALGTAAHSASPFLAHTSCAAAHHVG